MLCPFWFCLKRVRTYFGQLFLACTIFALAFQMLVERPRLCCYHAQAALCSALRSRFHLVRRHKQAKSGKT
jgi:hypothetical protein